jgi:hypothetical protein
MRTKCWANRSLAVAVTEAMAGVGVRALQVGPVTPVPRSSPSVMAKKGTKATRKFAASGQLTKKIQARRKHQQIQRKIDKNKNPRSKGRERPHVDVDDDEDEKESAKEIKSSKKRYVIHYHSRRHTSYNSPCWDVALKACQ